MAKKKAKKTAKKAAQKKTAKKAVQKKMKNSKAKSGPKKSAPEKATAAPKSTAQALLRLQPLDNRIVIEIKEHDRRTPGGLFIPDTAQMSGHFRGRVIAVGSGHLSKKGKKRPLELKVGDEVLFSEWAGDKLELNGKAVRILRESDVLGLVD